MQFAFFGYIALCCIQSATINRFKVYLNYATLYVVFVLFDVCITLGK